MPSKRELLEADETRWRELSARFERLDPEDWERPGVNGEWSPKDVLAHIAAWHAHSTDRFETLRATGALPPVPDVDAFNEQRYQECKELMLHDVRVMSGAARHRFREEVASLPEPLDDFVQQVIASNAHGHYDEHIPDLDRFLEAR